MPKFHPIFLSLLVLNLAAGLQTLLFARDTPGHAFHTRNVSQDTLTEPEHVPDTLGRMSTPSLVGTIDRALDSTRFITNENLHWLDYRFLGNALEGFPGVFVRDQFSEGQYSQVNIRGADWRTVAVTMNGRLLNDPASGIYNLFYFTPEFADRIEIITGPRSFLFALNSSGGIINLVTKNYNSNRPLSKINYSETAYDYEYSDGTFTQNISRKVNFTFGFQHQGTGGRFPNAVHDAWNMRVKLRYNVSRDFNIILSEYLTRTETGLNGGVDITQSGFARAFEPIQATMINTDAFEKTTRHDVDVAFVGTFLGDTVNVSTLTFYYSNNFREYRDEENRTLPNGLFIKSDHTSSWMGATFTQNLDGQFQRFSLGANVELRQIEGSPNMGRRRNVISNVWAKEEILLGGRVTLAGFGRYDLYRGESALSLGSDVSVLLHDSGTLYGGLSFSRRFPNYQELFWTDSTATRTGGIVSEKHRQAEVGVRFRIGNAMSLNLAYFHRTIDDPILLLFFDSNGIFPGVRFTNGGKITTNGIEGKVIAEIGFLHIEGNGTVLAQRSDEGGNLEEFPKLSLRGGIYFRDQIIKGNLDLKVGFRGRFVSRSQGKMFNPEIVAYVPSNGPGIGVGSSVDFVLIGRLGNAYVHFIWENLTDAKYFITPYYPVLDRVIRFGIRWQFLD